MQDRNEIQALAHLFKPASKTYAAGEKFKVKIQAATGAITILEEEKALYGEICKNLSGLLIIPNKQVIYESRNANGNHEFKAYNLQTKQLHGLSGQNPRSLLPAPILLSSDTLIILDKNPKGFWFKIFNVNDLSKPLFETVTFNLYSNTKKENFGVEVEMHSLGRDVVLVKCAFGFAIYKVDEKNSRLVLKCRSGECMLSRGDESNFQRVEADVPTIQCSGLSEKRLAILVARANDNEIVIYGPQSKSRRERIFKFFEETDVIPELTKIVSDYDGTIKTVSLVDPSSPVVDLTPLLPYLFGEDGVLSSNPSSLVGASAAAAAAAKRAGEEKAGEGPNKSMWSDCVIC